MALVVSRIFRWGISSRSRAGSIAFALVVTPFVILLLATTVEVGLILGTQNLLVSAMYSASRLGYLEENMTREETILAALEEKTGILLDPDGVELTSLAYDSFGGIGEPRSFVIANGNGQWEEGKARANHGQPPRIVLYTATYRWRMHTPLLGNVFGKDGSIGLRAHAVVRNESDRAIQPPA